MDLFWMGMIGGGILLVLATLWNILVSPQEKKDPNRLYKYFMDEHGFTTNDQANVFNGFYKGKSVQITTEPLQAFIPVTNPRGVHLLLEKGDPTVTVDLVDTPIQGLQGASVKSNYPLMVAQMLDEQLISRLNDMEKYAFELQEGLTIRCPPLKKPKQLEELLQMGVKLANALEQVNYAYQQ